MCSFFYFCLAPQAHVSSSTAAILLCGCTKIKLWKKKLAEYCPDDDPNRVDCTVEECKIYYMDGILSFCFVSFDLIIDLRLKFEI